MTQGIYLSGHRRPKSKKEIKEAVNNNKMVVIEATSIFGNEYGGRLSEMPKNNTVIFCGPNPHSDRRFYGTIKWNDKKQAWVVS